MSITKSQADRLCKKIEAVVDAELAYVFSGRDPDHEPDVYKSRLELSDYIAHLTKAEN